MDAENVAALLLGLFDHGLSILQKYRDIQARAAAENRPVNMDDVRVLQAQLRANQAELDALIAAMPDDPPPED